MFRTRLLSGILLVAAALAVFFAGGAVLAAAMLFVSVIAYQELTRACKVRGEEKTPSAPVIAGCVMTLVYYGAVSLALAWEDINLVFSAMIAAIVAAFLVFLFVYVFTFPKYHADQIMAAMFSFLYGPVMLSFLFLLREGFDEGIYLVWFAFLASWGSDTCAYCVGVLIGKHKMTPRLSPKKSIEGAVGGVLGAALLFVLYTHFVINNYSAMTLSLPLAGALGAAGALVSMVGDLAASAVKRDHEIKDYGKLIPGHGGIMDRFDSVIVAAPIVFIGIWLLSYAG
ncbi:MAG: phosphatidate cytidylyltransferase [Bacteroidales bacterium]|nr:phosphatidate cytidylyltransferase [Bacteroidales bacterium]MCM1415588.1 phosphatidate cytidylyltransferase [bacterium]MCM1422981.1 phosphatidate cytidylyltransferase [bacterium]